MRHSTTSLVLVGLICGLAAQPSLLLAQQKSAGTPGRFEREIRKKGCEILTPALVARTFGVPEGELKQLKVMGCVYSWETEGKELQASLLGLRTQKTLERAKTWFANSTKNTSRAEVEEQSRMIQQRLEEQGKVETDTEKKTSKSILSGVGETAGEGGFQFSKLPGVGDEAAISENDGGVRVRISNLQFTVQAYLGPKPPRVTPTETRDMQAMMNEVKVANAAWEAKTLPDRKRDSTRLAKAVVAALK